jgi:hypothetical protein
MNLSQFDFQQLSIKHILYKSKVRAALYGGEVDRDFFSDRTGPIGTWIYNKGMQLYGDHAEMINLEKAHREINFYVLNLITQYKRGQIEEARENLKLLETYSQNFQDKLSRLESKILKLGK